MSVEETRQILDYFESHVVNLADIVEAIDVIVGAALVRKCQFSRRDRKHLLVRSPCALHLDKCCFFFFPVAVVVPASLAMGT